MEGQICAYLLAMERVIPWLTKTAMALQKSGHFRSTEVVTASGKTESARKKFEDRDSGKAADEWAEAFASATGLTAYDYWRLVIDVAEAAAATEAVNVTETDELMKLSAMKRQQLLRELDAHSSQSPTSDARPEASAAEDRNR